ncbi:hypothetical protein CK203_077345 [Vitis vinifera]|uniref:BRCT domain-containing protein n=1 Tax=Vitis vinifera TaxID=29760 RepID=A0A438EXV8_VITVI|nr:hypothetical protein CK203_077345 [Vitis vinifera]
MGGGGGGAGTVEVISSKGCSRLLVGISSSLPPMRGLKTFEPMSPASSSVGRSNGPFSGLVICVTGLSKEARKQVMDATERLGGQYSPNLHPQCTHLVMEDALPSPCLEHVDISLEVVFYDFMLCFETLSFGLFNTFYSFGGRKLDHALKHGSKNGLFVVTLGWFVDSVRRNVRLSESLYYVKNVGENGVRMDELNRLIGFSGAENSCLPAGMFENAKQSVMTEDPHLWFSGRESKRSVDSTLSGHSMFIDSDISAELRNKVVEAAARGGAMLVDQWFVGCNANYVVCEGPSIQRYLGHSNNLVTPLWILKTAKERYAQRLVHMSADLARQVGMVLENVQNGIELEEMNRENGPQDTPCPRKKASHEERQEIVSLAKAGVRNRRARYMQVTICTSSLCMYLLNLESSSVGDVSEHQTSVFFDAKGDGKESEASFANFSRLLTESEKAELIFKGHFLTILLPVDRFAEMGPSSRTFFSSKGFTCLQVLDHIYAFYQENMTLHEIEAAIHTDSRHADRLRSVYSSKETGERGYAIFKRIDFLGSRKSFEMLKRVSGDNNSNVYELVIRA